MYMYTEIQRLQACSGTQWITALKMKLAKHNWAENVRI